MKFENYFQLTSYATIAAAALALLVAGGISVWLAGAFALTRVLATQLTGLRTDDPVAFVGVTVVLGVTALIASVVPAWRAASVDPLAALRLE